MDIKSKVLLWVLCLFLALSISATFYKTVVLHDFDYYESEEEIEDTEETIDIERELQAETPEILDSSELEDGSVIEEEITDLAPMEIIPPEEETF